MGWILLGIFILLIWRISKSSKPKQKWVNWVGACDEETCEGCRKAFEGNPYPEDKAPQPGSFECGDNCRHALQKTDPLKS